MNSGSPASEIGRRLLPSGRISEATAAPSPSCVIAIHSPGGFASCSCGRASDEDAVRLEDVYRPLAPALAVGAAVALLAGWVAPPPWLLAALLVAVRTVLWFFVVARMIRAGVWGMPSAGPAASD